MNGSDKKYKVGDKIVEFGQVFRIFKIDQIKNSEGEPDRILHFKPYFRAGENNGMTCSIPESSIDTTNIRRPHTPEEIKKVVNKLKEKEKYDIETDVDTIKEVLSLNDPHETAKAICVLWTEKEDETISFTKSKKDVLALATSRLVEEIALVTNVTPEKADSKIRFALENGSK